MTTRRFQRPVVILLLTISSNGERARRQSPHGLTAAWTKVTQYYLRDFSHEKLRQRGCASGYVFTVVSSLVSIRQTDIFLSVALTRNFTFLTWGFSVSWNFCSLKSSKKILSTSMDFPWYCNGHKDSSFFCQYFYGTHWNNNSKQNRF